MCHYLPVECVIGWLLVECVSN